jgi:transcriptional regulator with XRE-family HTH domain
MTDETTKHASAFKEKIVAGALANRLDNVQQNGGINAREIAQLLDTTPETVSRWRSGKTQPQRDRRDYLLRLEWLIGELAELYSPEEARLWLFSPHKQLNGDRPADRIHHGKIEDVLTVIAQLKDGAHV